MLHEDHAALFLDGWDVVAARVHQMNVDKGFWPEDKPSRNAGEALALAAGELVGEALEALRHGNPPSGAIPGFSQAEEEIADAVIRLMDFSEGMGWDVAAAIVAKIEYNHSRPHKHGKAF